MAHEGGVLSFRDARGIALPLALIVLFALTSLMLSFMMLSQSEPIIANNQALAAQARALAESGVERALWALSNPTNPQGIPDPMPRSPLPSPAYDAYNGELLNQVSPLGGFQVTVTSGSAPNFRNIVSVGWAPTQGSVAAHKQIQATAITLRDFNPPCALCVRSDATLTGTSSVDATQDTSCGDKWAVYSTATVTLKGNTSTTGPLNPPDATNQPVADFDAVAKLTDADLDALKAIAKANGTYYQGNITFDASNPIPKNGVIFVDTVSGKNPTSSTPPSDLGSLTIHGNAVQNPPFEGWIVVNGDVSISGNFGGIEGMVYAANNVTLTGFGHSGITGLVIAAEILGTGTGFAAGNANITYNCNAAKGSGQIPKNWFVLPGSYREVSG